MNKFLKTLFVEDIEDDAQLLLRELKKGGYNPTYRRVETAEQMSEALQSDVWDVIIADYNLPNFSGPEALNLLKQIGVDIPFIAVSGSIGEDNAVEILKQGAHDFITKTNLSRLIPAIEREIGDSNIRKQQKETEIALYQSEEQYRMLFETAKDGLFLFLYNTERGASNFIKVNSASSKMLGYSTDELLSLSPKDLEPPEAQGELPQLFNKIFDRNELSVERLFVRKDGTRFFVEISANPLATNDGSAILATVRDITQRKLAEESLLQSELQYRLMFNNNPQPMWVYDLESLRFLSVNDAAIAKYGYTLEEFYSMSLLDIRPPNDVPKLLKNISESDQELQQSGLWRHKLKDGRIIFVEIYSHSFDFKDKKARLVLANDVTERKLAELASELAEEALRESEKRYRGLFDSSPISLWEEDFSDIKKYIEIKRGEGVDDFDSYFDNNPEELLKCIGLLKILDINEATLKLYKAEMKSDVLQGLSRTSGIETLKDFKKSILAIVEGKLNFQTETENYTLDGKKLYVNITWKVLPGCEENCSRAIVSIADITDRKLAEEEIKTTNEELKILNKVILESASYLDIHHILENALDEALRITNLEGGTICLINPDNTLSLAAHRATSSNKIKAGDCLCGNCAAEKCPLILWTREEVLRYSTREVARGEDIRFHAAFPIIIKDKVLGVLCVFTRTDAKPTKRSLKLLETITSQMSLSLENAKLYEQSQNQVVTLQNLTEQFRLLAERLRTAREDERIGIAREIHDELGQVLTALKIDLTLFQNKLPKRNNFFKKDLEGIISLVDSIIKTVQKISTELRPAVLDDLGLNAAIEWQVWEFQNRTGIIFDVSKIEDIGKLERHTATALFRIFQEALTNIARHSAASKVEIVMKHIDSDIFLEIHDNGSGITTEEIEDKNSIGILGMKERAIALGGEFTISGSPGNGTVVTVRISG
ncbi:MAG: PAS domain S-box protein [Bacteroidota bacterium]|nr:PAS domain S-box protein [Bacteroidota bacterium]